MNRFEEIDEQLRQQQEATAASSNATEDSFKAHLGAGIYATVEGKYNGVDLRRYWLPKKQLLVVPTKSGIFLPSSQWTPLKMKLNDLIAARPELTLADECSHENQVGMMDCRECLPFGWIIKSFNEL